MDATRLRSMQVLVDGRPKIRQSGPSCCPAADVDEQKQILKANYFRSAATNNTALRRAIAQRLFL